MSIDTNTSVKIILKGGLNGIMSEADSDGNVYTLPEDYYYFFSSRFTYMYATILDISIFGGTWVSDIPDDTIGYVIWKISREIDAFAQCTDFTTLLTDDYFAAAVNQYVVGRVILNLLGATSSSAMNRHIQNARGYSKRVGDIEYSQSGIQPNDTTSGLKTILDRAQKNISLWEQTIQSCGDLRPGDDLDPDFAVKSSNSDLIPPVGREWETGSVPAANAKYITPRYQTYYTERGNL